MFIIFASKFKNRTNACVHAYLDVYTKKLRILYERNLMIFTFHCNPVTNYAPFVRVSAAKTIYTENESETIACITPQCDVILRSLMW